MSLASDIKKTKRIECMSTSSKIEVYRERIEVMEAFRGGRDVECLIIGNTNWHVMDSDGSPAWQWGDCNYRIKSEPKLVPLDASCDLVGKVVIRKTTGVNLMIVAAYPSGVWLGGHERCVGWLLLENEYFFLDGTPCAKVAE